MAVPQTPEQRRTTAMVTVVVTLFLTLLALGLVFFWRDGALFVALLGILGTAGGAALKLVEPILAETDDKDWVKLWKTGLGVYGIATVAAAAASALLTR